MEGYNSVGKCLFCGASFKKAGISRHLNKHLAELVKDAKPGRSYHVKVEDDVWNKSPYFLHLWVDGDAHMRDIDGFLRAIWLECCGHMSSFTDPEETDDWSAIDENAIMNDIERMMDREAKDLLKKGLKLEYRYDYGSTTDLTLTIMEEYPMAAKENIVLLSRNEPPEIMCDICGTEPASVTCSVCCDKPNNFCKKCAKKHAKTCEDFAGYAAAPVVNSPRMGVCAYEGGTIDKKRDGIFVKKGV